MELTKENAKGLMERDFIPGGQLVDITKLRFRRTNEHEVYRCCALVGTDPQSGPLFCGRVAEFMAVVKDSRQNSTGVVALCGEGKHKPPAEH